MGSTTYPAPAGALFVASTGNDQATGTERNPLRTLGAAVAKAPAGGTVVLRGGVYHESVKVPAGRRLTIQSAPHEAVWLDGSSPVTGWRQENGVWVHDGWTARFDSSPTYTSGAAPSADPRFQFVSPEHPMAAHPDQLWIDGSPQAQVASRGEVRSGTFYVDEAARRLYMGSDPHGHDVRASTLGHALVLRAGRSILRGIGIRRYATSLPELGSLRISGPNVTVEDVTVTDSATTGLSVVGSGARIRRLTVSRNGMLGVHANEADDLRLESVRAERNNLEHFNYAPVSGGIKITQSRGVALVGSLVADNPGKGVWLDESVENATLTGNRILRNASHGLTLELSAKAVVARNVITGNADDGLRVNNTSDVRIEGNTLFGNGRTIDLVQDSRTPKPRGASGRAPHGSADPAMTWKVEKITVRGNTLGRPRPTAPCLLCVDKVAFDGGGRTARITIDGNVYERPHTASPPALVLWTDQVGRTSHFQNLADLRSSTGQERHGRLKVG